MQQTPDQAADDLTADSRIGSLFNGEYLILKRLGRGGFGDVFKARDLSLDRLVALKVFRPRRPEDVPRFKLEAKTLSMLHHRNIVSVFAAGSCEGHPFLVCELIEGTTLWHYLQDNRPLSLDTALHILLQLADGLAHAHAKGIIHRDLKSGNVMISTASNGAIEARLIDFGCTKLMIDGVEAQRLTGTGEVFGTVGYMSPEQRRGEKVDARTDIYSFGLLLHELCNVDGKLPAVLQNIFERATAEKKCDRFPSMTEVSDSLKSIALDSTAVSGRELHWNRIATVLTVVVLTGIINGAIFGLVRPTQRDTDVKRFNTLAEWFYKVRDRKRPLVPSEVIANGREFVSLSEKAPQDADTLRALDCYIGVSDTHDSATQDMACLKAAHLSRRLYPFKRLRYIQYYTIRARHAEDRGDLMAEETILRSALEELEKNYLATLGDPTKAELKMTLTEDLAKCLFKEGNHIAAINLLKAEILKQDSPKCKAEFIPILIEDILYTDGLNSYKQLVCKYGNSLSDRERQIMKLRSMAFELRLQAEDQYNKRNYDVARQSYNQLLAWDTKVGSEEAVRTDLFSLGNIASDTLHWQESGDHFFRAYQLCKKMSKKNAGIAARQVACAYRHLNRPQEGLSFALEANYLSEYYLGTYNGNHVCARFETAMCYLKLGDDANAAGAARVVKQLLYKPSDRPEYEKYREQMLAIALERHMPLTIKELDG